MKEPVLVSPLEPIWEQILDAVLRGRRAPPISDVARHAPKLVELSRAYNTGHAADAPLDARIAFSFTRDVPKGAGAVRELVRAGVLAMPDERPLRVVDLGAGLGAMTWGVARALAAAGARGSIEALLVDADEAALAVADAIAREARRALPVEARPIDLVVRTRRAPVGPGSGLRLPRADVVLVGQLLSELDVGEAPDDRSTRHAELVRTLVRDALEPSGVLVVIEPALRDRTRHLHAVRDRLADELEILAPCLHARPCPALAHEGEWCHEDLAVDLPPWIAPLARAAGLRFQGLTFSYLVVRRRSADRPAASGLVSDARLTFRVISEPIPTKGKREIYACTDGGERARLRRLDRDATEANAAWASLRRGDVVEVSAADGDAPVDARGRLSPKAAVDVRSGGN